ncbi:uncharacterized protein LOC107806891 [Nicotiana tabacum]|uniref:Uncharacterized protein LOC107806891 n=3 Tax=Nicotiana TaxID=4085 RepID=A0AC58S5F0_TOBAC|nr:PREDICTED: uncharacterized protein LOC104238979 [Nicotiana sylvestris]XP_016486650.1 PREDICTED: uncharacterized protein LOC107806891 [Nicotiana tabacum]
MGTESWSLIGRLKRAVKKITFLLNLDMNKWKLISSLIGSSSRRHQLNFKEKKLQKQPTGLNVICFENDDLSPNNSGTGSNSFKGLQRTMSYPSSEDDIDKRAEMFIANFYKQLKLERQISLELRYCRGHSFGSSPSP